MFLQHFESGLLTNATVMLSKQKTVQIIKFVAGKYAGIIKHKKLEIAEETIIREEIQEHLFPLLEDTLQAISEASTVLKSGANILEQLEKRHKNTLIGSFIFEDKGLYFGSVRDREASGYGVYFSINGKVKFGHVKNCLFDGPCRMIDEGGLVMDAECRGGEFVGKSSVFYD